MKKLEALMKVAGPFHKKHEKENDDLYYSKDLIMHAPEMQRKGKISKFFKPRKTKVHEDRRLEAIKNIRSGKREKAVKGLGLYSDPMDNPNLRTISAKDVDYSFADIKPTDAKNWAGSIVNGLSSVGAGIQLHGLNWKINRHNAKAQTLQNLMEAGQTKKVYHALKRLDRNKDSHALELRKKQYRNIRKAV